MQSLKKISVTGVLFVSVWFCLFMAGIGVSWAWFSPIGEGSAGDVSARVETASLSITYNGGAEFKAQNILPGWTSTKTFTVQNTGNNTAKYNIVWENLTNTFTTKSDFVYSMTATNSGATFTETAIPSTGSNVSIKTNATIASGTTQTYTITFKYKNRNADQSADQNKKIMGKIKIVEQTQTT